jgi:hypothetical protein
MTIEAMKQALEALERTRVFVTTREKIKHPEGTEWYDERITALRTAIEQAEKHEPVAWMDEFGNVFPLGAQRGPKYLNEPMTPLYTTPQPCPTCEALARTVMMDQTAHDTQRHPLTEDQIDDIWAKVPNQALYKVVMEFARAIEAAHGITGEKK